MATGMEMLLDGVMKQLMGKIPPEVWTRLIASAETVRDMVKEIRDSQIRMEERFSSFEQRLLTLEGNNNDGRNGSHPVLGIEHGGKKNGTEPH